jgi:hypothetical protein
MNYPELSATTLITSIATILKLFAVVIEWGDSRGTFPNHSEWSYSVCMIIAPMLSMHVFDVEKVLSPIERTAFQSLASHFSFLYRMTSTAFIDHIRWRGTAYIDEVRHGGWMPSCYPSHEKIQSTHIVYRYRSVPYGMSALDGSKHTTWIWLPWRVPCMWIELSMRKIPNGFSCCALLFIRIRTKWRRETEVCGLILRRFLSKKKIDAPIS